VTCFLLIVPAHAATAELTIGVLLPPDPLEATSLRRGITVAIERANDTRSGVRAHALFRSREGQWGTQGQEAAEMVVDDGAQALIAPRDRAITHLALQVAGRTGTPVVTLCPDKSVVRAGIPWMVRIGPALGDETSLLELMSAPGPEDSAAAQGRAAFVRAFQKQFHADPDLTAILAHDAAALLLDLSRTSGGKPLRVQFPVAGQRLGASGILKFDRSGNRILDAQPVSSGQAGRPIIALP